jgi:hypothetical protein
MRNGPDVDLSFEAILGEASFDEEARASHI